MSTMYFKQLSLAASSTAKFSQKRVMFVPTRQSKKRLDVKMKGADIISIFSGLDNYLNPGSAAICTAVLASISVTLNLYGGILRESKRISLEREIERERLQLQQIEVQRSVIARYRGPLLEATVDLEQRIYHLITRTGEWSGDTQPEDVEEEIIYSLFAIAQFLGFVEVVRREGPRELSFLDSRSVQGTDCLTTMVEGLRFVLCASRPSLTKWYAEDEQRDHPGARQRRPFNQWEPMPSVEESATPSQQFVQSEGTTINGSASAFNGFGSGEYAFSGDGSSIASASGPQVFTSSRNYVNSSGSQRRYPSNGQVRQASSSPYRDPSTVNGTYSSPDPRATSTSSTRFPMRNRDGSFPTPMEASYARLPRDTMENPNESMQNGILGAGNGVPATSFRAIGLRPGREGTGSYAESVSYRHLNRVSTVSGSSLETTWPLLGEAAGAYSEGGRNERTSLTNEASSSGVNGAQLAANGRDGGTVQYTSSNGRNGTSNRMMGATVMDADMQFHGEGLPFYGADSGAVAISNAAASSYDAESSVSEHAHLRGVGGNYSVCGVSIADEDEELNSRNAVLSSGDEIVSTSTICKLRISRGLQRAIGSAMVVTPMGSARHYTMSYDEFYARYHEEPRFGRWFAQLHEDLVHIVQGPRWKGESPFPINKWTRLLLLQQLAIEVMDLLDPGCVRIPMNRRIKISPVSYEPLPNLEQYTKLLMALYKSDPVKTDENQSPPPWASFKLPFNLPFGQQSQEEIAKQSKEAIAPSLLSAPVGSTNATAAGKPRNGARMSVMSMDED